MIVTKKSMFSGKLNVMDLPITIEDLVRWESGELIQNVMPHLTADEREFLMTGATVEEWEAVFGDP